MARAPQSFYLRDIIEAYRRAAEDGSVSFIDSATMMMHYGHQLYTVPGKPENIKITTPNDFYMFRAIVDARENSQIFGI
jgi:2-C-methyl-D-erythritol 4-phosphate cytidylyltransferase